MDYREIWNASFYYSSYKSGYMDKRRKGPSEPTLYYTNREGRIQKLTGDELTKFQMKFVLNRYFHGITAQVLPRFNEFKKRMTEARKTFAYIDLELDKAIEEGKTLDDVLQKSERALKNEKEIAEFERMECQIVGIRNVDIYEERFSVEVLMNTSTSRESKKEFLQRRKRDFLLWVINKLKTQKSFAAKVKMEFFQPEEIILRNNQNVEVIFGLKKVKEETHEM